MYGVGQDKELSAGQRQYIPIEYNGETIYKWLSIIKVREYDGEGKLIYEGNGSTDNTWYEYDGQGNKICCKIESQRRGEVYYAEERYEYNTKGHLIRMDKKGSGEQHEVTYQYYKDKGILYCTASDGLIYAYDSKGYLLSKKGRIPIMAEQLSQLLMMMVLLPWAVKVQTNFLKNIYTNMILWEM